MAKEALGTVRIDFIANLGEAIKSLKTYATQFDKSMLGITESVGRAERQITRSGLRLTAQVTLPLVGLATAATKAADPTGKVSESLERLGLQAQKALEPLGKVLIRVLADARPTLEATVKLINKAAQAFSELNPRTQNMIIGAAALAAALGPVLLGLGAITTAVRVASIPVVYLTSGLFSAARWAASLGSAVVDAAKGLTTVATAATQFNTAAQLLSGSLGVVVSRLTLVAGTAVAAFKFGNYIYDNNRAVQEFLAELIFSFEKVWATIKAGAKLAFYSIKNSLLTIAQAAISPVLEQIQAVTTALFNLGAIAPKTVIKINETLRAIKFGWGPTFAGDNKGVYADMNAQIASAKDVYDVTMAEIARDFKGRDTKDRGFGAFLADDLAANVKSLAGVIQVPLENTEKWVGSKITDPLGSLGDMITQIGAKARASTADMALPFVQTKKEAEQTAASLKEFEAMVEGMRKRIEDIRFEIFPQDKVADQIADVKRLMALATDPRELTALGTKLKQLEAKYAALTTAGGKFALAAEAAIKGFADSASQTFADLVVDGKANFTQLLVSWEKTLIAMATKSLILQPLFDALGASVGKAFSSPAGDPNFVGPPAAYARANRGGMMGFDGRIHRFAGGGSVPGPSVNRDVVPALLTPGEYVMNRDAVTRIGATLLHRMNRGDMGDGAGGGVQVNIIDQRGSGERPQVNKSRGQDGQMRIDVVIKDTVNGLLRRGDLDTALRTTFGIRRVAAPG